MNIFKELWDSVSWWISFAIKAMFVGFALGIVVGLYHIWRLL